MITYVELITAFVGQESTSNTGQSATPTNVISDNGQLLFEDHFNTFNESLWAREIKMPLSPVGMPSLSFHHRAAKSATIKYLRINLIMHISSGSPKGSAR